MLTIQDKIEVVKKFIVEEKEARYKVGINLRFAKRKLSNSKAGQEAQLGAQVAQLSQVYNNSVKYQDFLQEVLEELEAGTDFELKDIAKA